jgi:hypothetical protein
MSDHCASCSWEARLPFEFYLGTDGQVISLIWRRRAAAINSKEKHWHPEDPVNLAHLLHCTLVQEGYQSAEGGIKGLGK